MVSCSEVSHGQVVGASQVSPLSMLHNPMIQNKFNLTRKFLPGFQLISIKWTIVVRVMQR